MDLIDLLTPNAVLCDLKIGSKKQLLQALATRAAADRGLDERSVFDVLLERERLGATGVGAGIAIPHGKLFAIERMYGAFARLNTPIDYEAIDERPVDLVFLLIAPEAAGADHLKALARVSRTLRDAALVAKIRAADDSEAIFALLTQEQSAAR